MSDFADVSSNNGILNLPAYAKTGATILGIKATEGTSYMWGQHAAYVKQWHDLGGVAWHYHFGRPGNAARQLSLFMSAVTPVLGPHDRLVFDYEANCDKATAAQFCADLAAERGPQMVYASAAKITETGLAHPPGFDWWQAGYGGTRPATPPGWPSPIAWQYTETGRSPICRFACDFSHYYGPKPVPVEDDMLDPTDLAKITQICHDQAVVVMRSPEFEQRIKTALIEVLAQEKAAGK